MIILPILAVAAVSSVAAVMHEEHFVGRWEGSLALPNGQSLPLVVKIKADAAGKLSGTLDSPAQGASDLPLSEVTGDEHNLRFQLAMVGGSFEGRLQDDDTIAGAWSQGGGTLPLILKRTPQG